MIQYKKYVKDVRVVAGVSIVVALLIGFAVGNWHASSSRPAGMMGGQNDSSRSAARVMRQTGSFVSGTVASITDTSLTISIPGGGSRVVLITPKTEILTPTVGSTKDITTGLSVVVSGTTNSDGSQTATSIQVHPAGEQGAPQQGR